MTTSGLGWTDLGKDSILGGLSREFYRRLYDYYEKDGAWVWEKRADFHNRSQSGGAALDPVRKTASVFEPKAAAAVFRAMLEESGVEVATARLDLAKGVRMEGGRIRAIRSEDGREWKGRMFIDASYEGDLLPGAKVSFTTGREANGDYNETINGIQEALAVKNQLPDGISPYLIPGDPASGLLPGVEGPGGFADGTDDARLQAYCHRMVLTDVPENRVMIGKPDGYDETRYEILFRAIEAGQKGGFFKFDLMPNRKTDSNNSGGISTDLIGGNWGCGRDWSTLGHDEREAMAKEHELWQRGLVWTLQNHPRVPAAIRANHAKWGLAKDEFPDNGHWPHQLYVREARRMVADVVMTEHHCRGREVAPDSVGLAAYTMDSHNVRRTVINDMLKNEGDVQVRVPGPYPVSYRALVPRRGECANLFVPWSLSATHMAFGSIRMEPVFMILSQSAAIAAGLCLDKGLDVQELPYDVLRPVLLEAGQALDPE